MTSAGNAAGCALAVLGAVLTASPVAAEDITGFTSPSGNIGCMLASSFVRCDIQVRDWDPPPRPPDCPEATDYGQGIELDIGHRPQFVCAGDTAFGGDPLDYGESLSAGAITCSSAEAGITCRDSGSGHGFTLARQAYRLF